MEAIANVLKRERKRWKCGKIGRLLKSIKILRGNIFFKRILTLNIQNPRRGGINQIISSFVDK